MRFEDEFPEEAQTLMQVCAENQTARLKGKRNKPLDLDITEPIRRNNPFIIERTGEMEFEYQNPYPDTTSCKPITGVHKIGRNDKCPCGSGKKYKKCCISA